MSKRLASPLESVEKRIFFDIETMEVNTGAQTELKAVIKGTLCEPEVLQLISKAVAAEVTATFKREIAILQSEVESLKSALEIKDQKIDFLEERCSELDKLKVKVDDLEQYG